jgi:hypothetical protein
MLDVRCANCGGLARRGGICGRCGAPQKRKILPPLVVAASLLVVVGLFVLAYRGQPAPTPGQTPIGVSSVTGEP